MSFEDAFESESTLRIDSLDSYLVVVTYIDTGRVRHRSYKASGRREAHDIFVKEKLDMQNKLSVMVYAQDLGRYIMISGKWTTAVG